MKEKLIEKFEAELQSHADNRMYIVINDYLMKYADNPDSVEKMLKADKSIGGAIEEMKRIAKKSASGGCGILTDEEGFDIVKKYFGISETAKSQTFELVKKKSIFDMI